MKPFTYFWFWEMAIIFLFSVVAGCEQSEPDFTRQTYAGGNIIKNGAFDEGLLHWGTGYRKKGDGEEGEYVEVIREDSSQHNHIAVIHSCPVLENGPGSAYIDDIANHVGQGFSIKPGDFQQLTIRAKVKSQGGAVPRISVGFRDRSKSADESTNYGKLDAFQKITPDADNVWKTVEFSRAIPVTADWCLIVCSGEVPDEKREQVEQSSETFKIYCDDIEAFLDTEEK